MPVEFQDIAVHIGRIRAIVARRMPDAAQAVRGAPLRDLTGIALGHQLRPQTVERHAGGGRFRPDVIEQRRIVERGRAAVPTLEQPGNRGRPRPLHRHVAHIVEKHFVDHAAEIASETLRILVVSHRNAALDGLRLHVIDQRMDRIPAIEEHDFPHSVRDVPRQRIPADGGTQIDDPARGGLHGRNGHATQRIGDGQRMLETGRTAYFELLHFEQFARIPGIFPQQSAAGRTAREIDVVVHDQLLSEPLRDPEHLLVPVEILPAQISRLHARAGLAGRMLCSGRNGQHGHAAEAGQIFRILELPDDLVRAQPSVQMPERHRTVFGAGIGESRPQRVGGLGPGQQQRRRDENQCMSESRHIRFGSIRSSVRAKRFVTFPASERSGPPRGNRNLSSRPETGNVFSRCHKNSENIVGDQPVRRHFTSETGRTFSIPFSCPPEGTERVRRPARRLKPEKISGSRLRIAAQIGSNGRKRAPDFA